MIDHRTPRLHTLGRTIVLGVIAVLCTGAATLWAWNAVVVELFAGPAMRFRHVLAVQTAVAATIVAVSMLLDAIRRRRTA